METYELFKSVDKLDEQRMIFFKKNIKSVYTKENPRRIIFFPKNKGSKLNLDDPVTRQCNGYILSIDDSGKIKPLVIPLQLLSYSINYKFVNDNINLYAIFDIQDGTILNLYWWEPLNSWRFSTAKGYDVTDLSWNGNETYKSIFQIILNENFKINHEDFYKELNKQHCYTFGFNHPKYHPFCKNNGNIWFIQSVDLDVEKNPLFQISYISPIPSINLQSKNNNVLEPPSNNKVIQHLKKICDDALNKYINNVDEINFGYILRSRNENQTLKYTNIIMESSLLRKIRNLYYDNYFRQQAELNGFNREKYTILYNYINKSTQSIFQLLFPRYNQIIHTIEEKFQHILNDIIKEYQNKNSTFYTPYEHSKNNTNDKNIDNKGNKGNKGNKDNKDNKDNKEYINSIISYIDSNIDININNQIHIQYMAQAIKSLSLIKVLYNLIFDE